MKDLHYSSHAWDLMLTEHNEARGCAKLNLLRARTVFLATGKHEIHDWKRRSKESDSNELIGLKMHLYLDQQQQHQITGSVEIYFYNGGYAGLEPIEDNKVNLCFLINRKIYKSCSGNWDYILDWLYGISPYLKQRLLGASALWAKPLAISGIPYGYVHCAELSVPQLFRLGDQIAVIHSLAGDGIAIALKSALLAAQSYVAGENSKSYDLKSQQLFKQPIKHAQLFAYLLSIKAGRKALFFLARRWPMLIIRAINHFRLKTTSPA